MADDTTRWTVIRRAAAGSTDARAEFARRYDPVIRAYLGSRWRGTPLFAEVDDAAQQVFVECFKEGGALGRADPDHGAGFGGYLYGVVRNVARAAERRRARSKEQTAGSDLDLDAIAAKEDSLAQIFDRAWASTLFREAAQLHLQRAHDEGPEAMRRHRILALRYGEGLPIREIAARWNEAPELLHRQLSKARREFRQALLEVLRELRGGAPEALEAECDRLFSLFS